MGSLILAAIVVVIVIAGVARGREIRATEQATRDTAKALTKR